MADYSESIEAGVRKWLEANSATIQAIIREEVAKSTVVIAKAIGVAAATEIGRFLDVNRHELISTIGAAMAAQNLARREEEDENRHRKAGA